MALFAALVALALAFQEPSQESSAPQWVGDLAQATEAARASGRPLLVVFR
jgi:hypothetical protein